MATNFSDNISDEIINIKCCFCAQDNRVREAEKYCVQCKDYYCAPCIETHRKFPGTKDHQLLDKSDFRSLGPDGSLPSFPTQRCALHPANVVDVFCADHDEVACASCVILTHRTCKNIHTIPEEIDSLYNSTELTNAKQKLYQTKTTMEEIKKEKEKKVKELKASHDKEVESVRAFRQELQTLLDAMEEQMIQELKKEYDRLESSLTEEINDINRLIDGMNEASSQLRKSEGNKAQAFICVKSLEKVIVKAEDTKEQQQQRSEETVNFTADHNIKTLLQQIQLLGKVSCNKYNSLYKVKNRREIDVKLADDSYKSDILGECRIWGSCLNTDGSLLLTDYNNKKLKLLDMNTGTITDYIMFQDYPRDVCLINKTNVAVTLNNNTVQLVSLGNKMTVTHTLTMDHPCGGLAFNDDKLYICDGVKTVYIHNINGQELRRVSTDASGKEIFPCISHITVSAAGDRVFVAYPNMGVVILDIQGNYLSTLTDPTLSGTVAVCTDGRNLFVCGHGSNNIVQIVQDNKLLGELVKVEKPLSLCFDPHKTRLIVTHFLINKITVLDLET